MQTGAQHTSGKARLVAGLGATGMSVVRHLARQGVEFAVTDSRAEPPGAVELRGFGPVPACFGGFDSPLPLDRISEAVISPGVSLQEDFIGRLQAAGIPLVGDIELFARTLQQRAGTGEPLPAVAAITGSNGKSTVTALLAQMAQAAGRAVAMGANFGTPALDLLEQSADCFVLELSSFQLELCQSLRPRVATVLNISADHIDRHGSLARYAAIKARIYEQADTAVVNLDDQWVSRMAEGHSDRRAFSVLTSGKQAGYRLRQQDDEHWLLADGEPICSAAQLRVRGRHNLANVLAAVAMADALGLPRAAQRQALEHFAGLPHRCQWVACVDGVDWVNDSKGTNVGAMLASLEGLPGPIVLLAGGMAKGGDFTPVGPVMARKGRAAVVFGADAQSLRRALNDHVPVHLASSFPAAMSAAREAASPGDTVLLSPGCASFDMFRDYRDRGDQFVAAVMEMAA